GLEPEPPCEQVAALNAGGSVSANAGEGADRHPFLRRSSFVAHRATKDERRRECELVLEAVGVGEAQRQRVASAVEPGGDGDAGLLEAMAPVGQRLGAG